MTRVKICGIRSVVEAFWAVKAGAWAVGFILAPSPRRLDVDEAARIIRRLPARIIKVGVFVDEEFEQVKYTVRHTGLNMLQFHGQESPEYCQEWAVPVIKSFRVKDRESLAGVKKYEVFAHLFDTYQEGSYGGTGRTFDWRHLSVLDSDSRVILAGGLNCSNVTGAVRLLRPFAVDVSSGVEVNGSKDRWLIEEFVSRVRPEHG
jgi:phosphoribosylanthranilate isomerase